MMDNMAVSFHLTLINAVHEGEQMVVQMTS